MRRVLALLTSFVLVAGITPASAQEPQAPPKAVTTKREMVVTANPLATAAGVKVLRQGGTAADAMVAVQTVLGLVEPQSSGLGGGAFLVWRDGRSGRTTTYDAREKAPYAATEDRFEGMDFPTAWQSGLSVGVPGAPRLMEKVQREHGKRPWKTLFSDATRLAQGGFRLTATTSKYVSDQLALNKSCTDRLYLRDPVAFRYFTNGRSTGCAAKPAGTRIRNKAYADTLRALRNRGADAFYTGRIARAIVRAVRTDPAIPGDMTLRDLLAYRVVHRDPVCSDYRGHEVCGMGPPSSGAIAVGQILGILEHFDLGDDPLGERFVHLFAQAGRLAFADRNKYVGDPDYVTVPTEGLLDEDYLAERAALVDEQDMGTAQPGNPPGEFDPASPQRNDFEAGTSHVSIVDRWGNALSMTTTVESVFGNGVMVPGGGFLLNNQLTDFSFAPTNPDGTPVANRVEPGKRPRSSMSPTIITRNGRLELVTGSPGGSSIIGYTAQSIVNVLDFGLDPQEAVNVPHHQNRNATTELERPRPGITDDYDPEALAAALRERGHPVSIVDTLVSGLSVIQVLKDGLVGGADHRRDGTVGGR